MAQPFRYTGREWDAASELYHYRARQYDPETGKFLQEDPIGMLIGISNNTRYIYPNPNYDEILKFVKQAPILAFGPDFNLNLHRYVGSNPVNFVDGSGHFQVGLSYIGRVKWGISKGIGSARLSVVMLGVIAKRQSSRAVSAIARTARNSGPCAAAFAAGYGIEGFGLDMGGGDVDAFARRQLDKCYESGVWVRATQEAAIEILTGMFNGGGPPT